MVGGVLAAGLLLPASLRGHGKPPGHTLGAFRPTIMSQGARPGDSRRGTRVSPATGQWLTMPTTRLMAVARMLVPKTYDRRQCRSTMARIVELDTLVSETW